MIKQIRPFYTPEQLKEIYLEPHNHDLYGRGHHIRVELTKVLAIELASYTNAVTGADLSCGNGSILKSIPLDYYILGDYAPGYKYSGPLDDNLHKIPSVDIYVCSETLEHLENPQNTLHVLRKKAKSLVLTTPIENWDDPFPEHYWAWDRKGVERLLTEADWQVVTYVQFDQTVLNDDYIIGMWCCT